MKKRILSLALVLMLCLGMSVPALAADSATVGQVNTISLGFNGLAVVDANGTLWVSDPDYQDWKTAELHQCSRKLWRMCAQ